MQKELRSLADVDKCRCFLRVAQKRFLCLQSDNQTSMSDEKVKEVFTLFDWDEDGKIQCSQIGTFLRSIGMNPAEATVQELEKSVGDTEFVDFATVQGLVATAKSKEGGVPSQSELKESFNVFDTDGSGTISGGEFRHVMMNLGEKMSEQELDNMMAGFNQNEITLDTFYKMFKSEA
eukprot:g23724.t1